MSGMRDAKDAIEELFLQIRDEFNRGEVEPPAIFFKGLCDASQGKLAACDYCVCAVDCSVEEVSSRYLVDGRYSRLSELGLSRMEQSIAACLLDGASPDQIAEQLERSIHTVRTHIRNIYRKTRVSTRAQFQALLEPSKDRPTGIEE